MNLIKIIILKKKILQLKKSAKLKVLNHQGQSVIEYVMLMSILFILSFSFMGLSNKNIAKTWINIVKLVTETPDDVEMR